MVPLNYWVTEFPLFWEGTIRCFLSCFECVLPSVFGPEGTDWEPKLDFRMDESSDVPILEERSSSPIDFLQEQWLVGTDIENIERYTDCACSLKFILTMFFWGVFSCSLNCIFLSDNSAESASLCVFTEICERCETYSANSGRRCHCHWKTKVCVIDEIQYIICVTVQRCLFAAVYLSNPQWLLILSWSFPKLDTYSREI